MDGAFKSASTVIPAEDFLEPRLLEDETWLRCTILGDWFTDDAMEESNTGLDSTDVTTMTTNDKSGLTYFPENFRFIFNGSTQMNSDTTLGTSSSNDTSPTLSASLPAASPIATTMRIPLVNSDSDSGEPVRGMYQCNKCPRSYKYPKSLREHRQSIHEKRRYWCDVVGCKKSVAQKKNLKRHKEIQHGLPANSSLPVKAVSSPIAYPSQQTYSHS